MMMIKPGHKMAREPIFYWTRKINRHMARMETGSWLKMMQRLGAGERNPFRWGKKAEGFFRGRINLGEFARQRLKERTTVHV